MRDIYVAAGSLIAGAVIAVLSEWIIGKMHHRSLLRQLRNMLRLRRRVSLQEELLMAQLLAEKIQSDGFKPTLILAVVPGGLMIAEWLSRRELGSRDNPLPVGTVYVGQERDEFGIITKKATVKGDLSGVTKALAPESRVLLVINVCRGGTTLEASYKFLSGLMPRDCIRTAALFCPSQPNLKINYYVERTDETVVFDWKASFAN